jgi:hypothetical protein
MGRTEFDSVSAGTSTPVNKDHAEGGRWWATYLDLG